MKTIASIAVLSLLAATPAFAAETGATANSNTTMSGSMQGSMSGTMMMSAKDHAKMTDKEKKDKAKAMSDSATSTAAPGGTMTMTGGAKH
jgi:hypothetical protein